MVSSKFDLAAVQVLGTTLVGLSDAGLRVSIVPGRAALTWCNVTFSFQNLILSSADLAVLSQQDKLILSPFYEAIWEDVALISTTSIQLHHFELKILVPNINVGKHPPPACDKWLNLAQLMGETARKDLKCLKRRELASFWSWNKVLLGRWDVFFLHELLPYLLWISA